MKVFLGILDLLAAPFGFMAGKDINFPLLWKVGCGLVLASFWLYVAVDRTAAGILNDIGLRGSTVGHLALLAKALFPGLLGFMGVCMIVGGARLQQGKSFMTKFGKELEPLPAFESGFSIKLGDIKLSLRDTHTGIGAFGGIGSGKISRHNCLVMNALREWVAVGSIEVGELIQGPYGPREVLEIKRQENHAFWEVKTVSGKKTFCGPDHLWWYKISGEEGEVISETKVMAEVLRSDKKVLLPIPKDGNGIEWEQLASVTFEGTDWGCCFVLAGTEHLYIVDGIITHNCLDPEQDVLMYDGTIRKVKNVDEGDLLMGPDGKARRVIVTSTGYGPLYRITPIKGSGRPWICNDIHMMTLRYTNQGGSRPNRYTPNGVEEKDHWDRQKHYKGISQVFGEVPNKKVGRYYQRVLEEHGLIMDVPLKDFIGRKAPSRRLDLFWKLFRPEGIEFPDLEEFDPSRFKYTHAALNEEEFYLAGAWIGDGYIADTQWFNMDANILESIRSYFEDSSPIKRELVWETDPKKHADFRVVKTRKVGAMTALEKYLLEFTNATWEMKKGCAGYLSGLYNRHQGKYDKDIPHWALTAPRAKRLALLAGLLDTDGSLQQVGRCFDFAQKRKWIVEKTVWLCRSLGLAAADPYESWKECTNRARSLPTVAELHASPALLAQMIERGILKLGLRLEEEKVSQAEHDELIVAFKRLKAPAHELALAGVGHDGHLNYKKFTGREGGSRPEENRERDLEALLLLHQMETRERYWRTNISGDIEMIPTRVPHKQVRSIRPEKRADGRGMEHIEERNSKDALCFGWDAEPIGDGPYCGFTLDGDGRFLLGDFTVTHNTVAMMVPLMRQFFRQLRDADDTSEYAKCGALILDEKGDFIDSTITEMMLAGRSLQDLVIIDPDLDLYRYNPLDPDQTADENAEKLGKVQKILGGGSGGDNKYWDDTSKATIKYFLQLLEVYKPKNKIGLDDIARFMRDDALATALCDTVEKTLEEKKKANEISEDAYGSYTDAVSSTRNAWINLNPNTKSTLKTTIANMLGPIAQNPRLQKVFCRDTNFSFKDLPNKGKVVLFRGSGIDKATARLICVCLKIDFQTWQKRRNGSAASAFGLNTTRTVIFLCDEYQEFVTCGGEGDETFYGVSRSTRTAPIVATQSYNSLETAIKNKEQTKTLRQNIATWVFFRSTDQDTCELGKFLAGQSKKEDFSTSVNQDSLMASAVNLGNQSGKENTVNVSKKLEENFRTDDFSRLVTMTMEKSRSGPWYSEAIIYHYHDIDADSESRCYKTRLPHLYYDNTLRKSAGNNVRHLDWILIDRNWQRKAMQRGMLLIQRAATECDQVKQLDLLRRSTQDSLDGEKAKIDGDPSIARQKEALKAQAAALRASNAEATENLKNGMVPGMIGDPSPENMEETEKRLKSLQAELDSAETEEDTKRIEIRIKAERQMLSRLVISQGSKDEVPKKTVLRSDADPTENGEEEPTEPDMSKAVIAAAAARAAEEEEDDDLWSIPPPEDHAPPDEDAGAEMPINLAAVTAITTEDQDDPEIPGGEPEQVAQPAKKPEGAEQAAIPIATAPSEAEAAVALQREEAEEDKKGEGGEAAGEESDGEADRAADSLPETMPEDGNGEDSEWNY